MRLIVFAFALAACSAPPSPGRQPETGVPAPEPAPRGKPRLVIASEELAVLPRGTNEWEFREEYRIRNDGAGPGAVAFVLTEHPPCGEHDEHCHDATFGDLETSVGGTPARYAISTISDPSRRRGPTTERRLDVSIPPGKTVAVAHRYHRKRLWIDNGMLGIFYPFPGHPDLRGRVEKTRIAVRPHLRPWDLGYRGPQFELSSFRHWLAGDGPTTEIVFTAGDRVVRGDDRDREGLEVVLYMLTADGHTAGAGADCPELLAFDTITTTDEAAAQFRDLTGDAIAYCRDLVYARHGKSLGATKNAIYYLPPRNDPVEGTRVGLSLNPEYDDALLSPAERTYVAAADEELARRGKKRR